ncbi:MAG: 3-hydroxyacyl-CoA dehydrogenase family protein [candidate division NC10 bacterium]|uniref:3-hydroxyacyl-CoA dehydrogenase family protein n=1 Tax=Tectimicrobiota bacterium TaxID=2528274 RepID=A0A932MP85_UNCTE|nr:3-hydroxyacyl-CoA dehydrogenase family protein [candidate division NC10 bacterium]MBI3128367.1 3-hydroxyacyl-CoA dehydrogenase family protein [Candidatus Tectomicrobia bacterium]
MSETHAAVIGEGSAISAALTQGGVRVTLAGAGDPIPPGCALAIEALPGGLAEKGALLRRLAGLTEDGTVLATSTGTLSAAALGAASGCPERVVALHFRHPAPFSGLVEVAPGPLTGEGTVQAAVAFLKGAGLAPLVVKDTPGFILNRLFVPFLNDCIRLVESGYATSSDIDVGVQLGLGYKMGPMRLLDIQGLDRHREAALSLFEQLGDPRYAPPPLADRMIASGRLGMKSGRGFFTYQRPSDQGDAEALPEAAGARDLSAGTALAEGIRRVGVIGLGAMGSGIAQVCATSGLEVSAVEVNAQALEAGLGRVQKNLADAVQRGKMQEAEKEATLGRLRGSADLESLAGCDLVIEAAVENLDLKLDIFKRLGGVAGEEAILATNTSCLPVTAMAAQTRRPGRVLGLHFFNPPYAMRLVEVIEAQQTEPEIAAFGLAFCRRLGKISIPVKDRPGFLVNRLVVPFLNHAAQLYDEGLAPRETLDQAVREGLGHPMGPLTLSDLVGVDVLTFVAEAMARELYEPRFGPPPLLSRMTAAGWLGRKSGRGFYGYEGR